MFKKKVKAKVSQYGTLEKSSQARSNSCFTILRHWVYVAQNGISIFQDVEHNHI
jgi:hypothetical protein